MNKRIIMVSREQIQYYDYCPYCKQEIKGTSESQVKFNLDLHINNKHLICPKCNKTELEKQYNEHNEGIFEHFHYICKDCGDVTKIMESFIEEKSQ